MVWVGFRESSNGSYVFDFEPYWHNAGFSFVVPPGEVWEDLGKTPHDYQKNTWYSVRVEAYGKQIKAYVDGTLLLVAEDTRLKNGRLTLSTIPTANVRFDDIRVSQLPPQ
jgi:hypothetical protein